MYFGVMKYGKRVKRGKLLKMIILFSLCKRIVGLFKYDKFNP